MFVLYLENYPQSLRVQLKTYLYEIKTALYVGTVSAQIRDMIWQQITEHCEINAVMIYPDKTEQKFSVKMHGETKRKIEDFNGLWAVTCGQLLNLDLLKSKQSTKPLICHFYETAYTTYCLLNGYFKTLLNRLADLINEDVDNLKNMLLFFSFLHDIGKIHSAFQFKLIPDVLTDFGYENNQNLYDGFRHEVYGEKILSQYIEKTYGRLGSRNLLSVFPKTIKCHHQGKSNTTCPLPSENADIWTNMQLEVIDIANKLFAFNPTNVLLKETGNGVFEILLGIINLSDWMASTQSVFDDKTPNDFSNFEDYVNHLINQCEYFLQNNLMNSITLDERFGHPTDWWKLLIGQYSPRPMQSVVASVVDRTSTPSLLFIEDSCGGGKTEAAMYYALAQAKNANGIYFALPTTATSENMRKRVDAICKLGIDNDFKVPVYNSMAWMQDEDVRLDSNLWQNDAKLKLFYPIAVGTVDQLLMSVQGIKYSDLGLIALANKVLIIDEMHAYDAYMLEELKTLFSYCALMGVSIIVLSATLTNDTKKQLIEAYNIAKPQDGVMINNVTTTYDTLQLTTSYPAITKVVSNNISETISPISKTTQYDYKIMKFSTDALIDNLYNKAMQLIQNEGTVAVVCNTVAKAIEIYRYIKDKVDEDVDVELLHSRFSIDDKNQKINNILNKYGPDRTNRPNKSILVSTQIIEQSLDVDFDYMITEIAPIDLIEQRFGRVRRHDDVGTIREKTELSGPSVFIFYEDGFGKSVYVYEKQILQATLDYLNQKTTFRSPQDVKDSIETVYSTQNLNLLKSIRQAQQADIVSIGKVNCREFWRFTNLSSLRNDPHTRYESTPSTNIILLTDAHIARLEAGESLSRNEIHEIIKTSMYSSVPIKKIETLQRIETNNEILDEYYVFKKSDFDVSNEFGLQIS